MVSNRVEVELFEGAVVFRNQNRFSKKSRVTHHDQRDSYKLEAVSRDGELEKGKVIRLLLFSSVTWRGG